MKKTNILAKFKNSIYNIKEIPGYINEGLGSAILYALLLCLFLGLGKGIALSLNIKQSMDNVSESLKEDKFKFTIENGILDIDTSPLKIDEDNFLIYIDDNLTLDKANELKNFTVNANNYVLVLKDGLIINSNMGIINQGAVKKITYSDLIQNDEISNDYLISQIEISSILVVVLVIIAVIFSTFISFIRNAFFIGLFSMLNSVIFRLDLKISQLFSMAIYAGTLPSLLVLALSLFAPLVNFETASMVGTMVLSFFILRNMGIKNKI